MLAVKPGRALSLIRHTRAITTMSVRGEYKYEWPRPAVTVDAVLVSKPTASEASRLLLIQRKQDPFAGAWALPGGFVDEMEPLDKAAKRELEEETSVILPHGIEMTQVGAFGDPGRDPRGWTVGVAFAAIVPTTELGVSAADDAADAAWFDIDKLPALAFDHKLIVKMSYKHLAKEDAVNEVEGLKEKLLQAASLLEGPWQT